ncbi:MAG TPA: type II secretion system F family protein [Oligoflexia bacterium]|nr:type II secretion system F family protein [Oligoflexia bacterium]HMP26983.1 type II secretion system F family protein [Oligoflexia bacterium]
MFTAKLRAECLLGENIDRSGLLDKGAKSPASSLYTSALPSIVWEKITFKKGRIRKEFARDYPALLTAVTSSVKTGLDPLEALLSAENQFSDSPVALEIKKVALAIEAGATSEQALAGFASDIDHPDVPSFITALVLGTVEGAPVADSLNRLLRVTRQRESFRRKTRSALASQRLSAIGASVAVALMATFQFFTNKEGVIRVYQSQSGFAALVCGGSLIGFGLIWMFSMGRKYL